MSVALRRAEQWPTTPIVNILQSDREGWSEAYVAFILKLPKPLTDTCRTRLGKPAYSFVGETRFHVWECPAEGWRVFVSNKIGLGFEVPEDATPATARAAWAAFVKAMSP